MLEWLAAVLLAAISLSLLLLPGLLVLGSLGAGPRLAVAGAPGTGIIVVTAGTVVMPFLGLGWTRPSASLLLLLVCLPAGAVWLLRSRRSYRRGRPGGSWCGLAASPTAWAALLGVVLAALLQVAVLVRAAGSPSAILQNHDVMFHLNYVVEIMDSGNASPLGSSQPVNGGGYYPNLWHTLAALVPTVDVPTAFNVIVLMVSLFLAPLGCALLGRAAGGGPVTAALAPSAGAATMWFPGFPLYFHGQAPTALSVALVPFALAALLEWYRSKGAVTAVLAVVAGIVGAGAAHAGAGQLLVVVVAALTLLWSVQVAVRGRGVARLWSLLLVGLAALVLWAMCLLPALGAMSGYDRQPRSMGEVLVGALTLAPLQGNGGTWHYWPVALAALCGLVLTLCRRRWEVVTAWGTVLLLVVLTASPQGWWRALVGGWWRDDNRYLGLLAVLSGVLAACAVEAVLTWCAARLRQGGLVPVVGALLVGSTVAVASWVAVGTTARDTTTWARRGYDASALIHLPWVTTEETRFIQDAARDLPTDAVVYGYPASGAGLFPVLAGADSIHRTSTSRGAPYEEVYLARQFNLIHTDPVVCQQVRARGGTPVYYQDTSIPPDAISPDFSGYVNVDTSQGFTLLASEGTASLWLVTACDGQADG
ncbi:DUF6541 family protein [Actinomyces wuliandei]|uniref:DUF6541 family protein n=1 Tax=Actinomyces wuliandei TaxID=2057743 RepID=UPI000FDA6939|nr:DUF6541 family protein [Actinomyces wuliandei]